MVNNRMLLKFRGGGNNSIRLLEHLLTHAIKYVYFQPIIFPLVGPIPPELGNLAALEKLDLGENQLTGKRQQLQGQQLQVLIFFTFLMNVRLFYKNTYSPTRGHDK